MRKQNYKLKKIIKDFGTTKFYTYLCLICMMLGFTAVIYKLLFVDAEGK